MTEQEIRLRGRLFATYDTEDGEYEIELVQPDGTRHDFAWVQQIELDMFYEAVPDDEKESPT